MRASLSCQWCRKSKIKCRHKGAPPCQACASNPFRECVLSLPGKKAAPGPCSALGRVGQVSRVIKGTGLSSGVRREVLGGALVPSPGANVIQNESSSADVPCVLPTTEVPDSGIAPNNSEYPLADVARETVISAVEIFQQRFAMFSFLHGPTLLSLIYGGHPLDLRFCGILAVCARFIPQLIRRHGSPPSASEHFASYLRSKITCQAATGHDIAVAQALLLLSFHDWGSAKGGQAWAYIGKTQLLKGLSGPRATPFPDVLFRAM
ncbi:unnamed protein product [Aspergillus oryzae RIB40]|uniref:DNA, SC011 n=1 Tax=Aspergillus oryzae (strain ATCC 42149 / RIB 40) TaxID=510516 RepID=Q2TZW9_ASPOR|nr:unnamed protein product [Aspergillus oryzae RIB40]BAE65146.1 unnamed protein product [Aspergillus oryzae RIB40]